jgi:predicted ATPase
VGRTDEIARVRALLADKTPVITLVGPGGIGKTRLAREVAAQVGLPVTFIDAAAARNLDDLLFSLAHALGTSNVGLRGAGARLDQIVRAVSFLPDTLLLIDNLEHLLDAGRQVVGALTRAEVRLLTTSREPLRLPEEHCVLIGPLPDPEGAALYRQRAEALAGRPVPDSDEIVTELVRALDGHPLSLELAAARAMVLSASELLALHTQRLDLLSTQDSGRHGSLRRCLDWTWQLLSAEERAALARLTVLRGSFPREAAGAVLGLPPLEALGLLQSLCERSVLVSEPGPPTRFRLLEGVRAHAAEQLSEAAGREARQAWREHVSARALQLIAAEPVPHADIAAEAGDLRALARDGAASPRQRAVASTALALSADVALGERRELVRVAAETDLAGDLADDALYASALVSVAAGELEGARRLLRRVAAGAASARRRLRAQLALAQLTADDQPAQTAAALAPALAAARQLEAPGLELEARVLLARATRRLGQLEEAREHLAAALQALQAHRGLPGAWAHLEAAELAYACQQPTQARQELALALAGATTDGLSGSERARLSGLASELTLLLGDGPGALELARAAVRGFGALGAQGERGLAIHALATLQQALGELGEARASLQEAELAVAELPSLRALLPLHRAALDADSDLPLQEPTHSEPPPSEPSSRSTDTIARGYLAHLALARARAAAREGGPPEPHLDEAEAAREALQRAGYRLDAARLGAALLRTRQRLEDRVLRIGPGGQWFALSESAPLDLSRKTAAARVLQALADAHLAEPGSRLGIEALASAGWPGERIVYRAARDRVYNVIATLRRLGIRDALVHADDGYAIHPQLRVERVP